MKLFQNKFFIWFLVLAVGLYSLSVQIAQAEGVLTAIVVVAVVVLAVFAPYTIPITTELFLAGLGSVGFLTTVTTIGVATILSVGGVTAGIVACLEGIICPGGQTSGVVLAPVAGQGVCAFQLPLTFYNPQMGQTSEWFVGPYTYPADYDLGYPSYTADACQTRVVDETQKQVAIYRFTLPADSSQATLNDWFINQIKQQVGNGYTDYANGDYHTSADSGSLVTIPYSQLCSGNVCKFTDATVPQNVYVAYVAKILADYIYVPPPSPPLDTGGFLWPTEKAFAQTCGDNRPNKFFNKDNASNAIFPDPYVSLGNAIIGPLKTGVCPAAPTIDFKGAGQVGVVELPDAIELAWATENADTCVASGDWSGSKQAGPLPYKTESLTKPRGNYNFILTCSGLGGSTSSTVSVGVIELPHCSFTATPTSIIPPQTSTLSWSCQYANTCSINQGIGSVNNISGTKQVRPTSTTAYTLTCQGFDGSRSFPATVTISFVPQWIEVLPR